MAETLLTTANMTNEHSVSNAIDAGDMVSAVKMAERATIGYAACVVAQIGPSVDLRERAAQIRDALDYCAKGNQDQGFMDSRKAKYPDAAGAKAKTYYRLARLSMKKAYGYDEMVAAGIPEQDVEDDFVQMFFRFKKRYQARGDAAVRQRRSAYRKTLSHAMTDTCIQE